MKVATKSNVIYVVAFAVLIFWGYFVQADTRRVDGTSMLPTLEGGDLVIIQSVPYTSIQVGNIIVYNGLCSAGGESVVHRVVAITAQGLITEGDNNPGTDQSIGVATGPITPQCVEGKVVYVIPYVELLAYYIDQHGLPQWFNYLPSVLILLAVLGAILFQGRREEGQDSASVADGKAEGPGPEGATYP